MQLLTTNNPKTRNTKKTTSPTVARTRPTGKVLV